MSEGHPLLGIDNVIFNVTDLEAAVSFYERWGFILRFRADDKGLALFSIGKDRGGLLLRRRTLRSEGATLWVEVEDATGLARAFDEAGLPATVVETATGLTCEIDDPSGNTVGFADYSRRPELARKT